MASIEAQLTLLWTSDGDMALLSAVLGSLGDVRQTEEAVTSRPSIPDVGLRRTDSKIRSWTGMRELSQQGHRHGHLNNYNHTHHATVIPTAPARNMSVSHSLVWKRPGLAQSTQTTAAQADDGEFRRKKLKLNDLPIASAKRTAIDGLLLTFKKSGEFDKLRKGIFNQFEISVSFSITMYGLC